MLLFLDVEFAVLVVELLPRLEDVRQLVVDTFQFLLKAFVVRMTEKVLLEIVADPLKMLHLMVKPFLFVVILLILMRKVIFPVDLVVILFNLMHEVSWGFDLAWFQVGIPFKLSAAYRVAEILSKGDGSYNH